MIDRDERKVALSERSTKRLLALYQHAEGALLAAQAAIQVANQAAANFRQQAAAVFEANNLALHDNDQLEFDLDNGQLLARPPQERGPQLTPTPTGNGPAEAGRYGPPLRLSGA